MNQTVKILAVAIDTARNGVEYNVKDGALCPFCGQRVRVQTTKQWLGSSRLRYHKCENVQCPLHVIDETIRSWQEA